MLKLSKTEVGNYPTGWREVTIAKAIDGVHNGTRCIDLYFKDLPENLKCRVWSAVNADTGEEFSIGNLFRYAHAGITDEGDHWGVDDHVRHLKDKTLNVLFYENDNGFTDASQRVVPVISDDFSEGYVKKLKTKTESWVRGRTNGTTTVHTNGTRIETVTSGDEETVPF